MLQDVKKILLTKYPTTTIRGDGPVVVVNFRSYKIELVPACVLGEGYYIPNTHDGGSWDRTEPQSEIDNIRQSNKRSNGNTINLIKMIKAWKHYCNVPIKSFAIELRAVNFLKKWEHYNKSTTYYDWMIRDYFKELLNYVNYSCKIPGTSEKLSYGNRWESKAKTALKYAIRACEYESKEQPYNASDEWKKIFGSRFEY